MEYSRRNAGKKGISNIYDKEVQWDLIDGNEHEQAQGIKEAMVGKDVLARARTGSGKTGAYCLPTLHAILQEKMVGILKDSYIVFDEASV